MTELDRQVRKGETGGPAYARYDNTRPRALEDWRPPNWKEATERLAASSGMADNKHFTAAALADRRKSGVAAKPCYGRNASVLLNERGNMGPVAVHWVDICDLGTQCQGRPIESTSPARVIMETGSNPRCESEPSNRHRRI